MHNKARIFIVIIVVFTACFLLFSCENEEEPENSDETPELNEPTVPPYEDGTVEEDKTGEENGDGATPSPTPEVTPTPDPEHKPEPKPEPQEPVPTPVYTVKFKLGYNDLENVVTTNGVLTAPANPERYGYKFLGWFCEDSLWNFQNTVSSDLTITAKWSLVDYSITYVLGSAENNAENPSSYNIETPTFELLNPYNPSAFFEGWYLDAAFTVPFEIKEPISDITVYAKFVYPCENLTYEKIDDAYYVSAAPENDEVIVIPSEYSGLRVVGILDDAFCSNKLKRVFLPDSLKYISKDAFTSCTNLSFSLYGGAKYLPSLNNQYFALIEQGDDACENIEINEKCIIISDFALSTYKLKTVTGGESIKYIGNNAFKNARALSDIDIFDSVIEIGDYAFSSCRNLTHVKFSENLEHIGKGAFEYCEGLLLLELPEGISEIPSMAFFACVSLEKIVLGKGIKTLGINAFGEISANAEIYYTGTELEWQSISLNSNFELNLEFINFEFER